MRRIVAICCRSMRAGGRLWTAIALLALATAAAAVEIGNVRVAQSDGRVAIDYDLDAEQPADVVLRMVVDGRLRGAESLRIDGHVGAGVAPGKDRRIAWHVLGDYPQGYSGEVQVGLHVRARRLLESDLVAPSEQQSEVFRRIEAERIDVADANRHTVFVGKAHRLAAIVDTRLLRSYHQEVDVAHLDKSRYYCARFNDQALGRFRAALKARVAGTAAPAEDLDARWHEAKAATPTIDDDNHDKYLDCVLRSLDPHSAFLNAAAYRDVKASTQGRFAGVGIEIAIQKGALTVVSPIEDTPASRAGIRSGDRIAAIDGRDTRDMPLADAVRMMRGERGTRVVLSLLRAGLAMPLTVELERDVVAVRSVRTRLLDGGYGYIRLRQFQESTADDFGRALESLREAAGGSLSGLVLDLRNDPGGLLRAAVRIASRFIEPNGLVVYTRGREQAANLQYRSLRGAKEPRYPMVVLINGGSASASEIVAGALQDHRRATIVGARSFGKGSVQTIIPIEDMGLKLTTSLYYTPSGRSIQQVGIAPDIVLDREFASDEAAAAFGRRLLLEPAALADAQAHAALAERAIIDEFATLYRNAVRSTVAIAPPPPVIAPPASPPPVAEPPAGAAKLRKRAKPSAVR